MLVVHDGHEQSRRESSRLSPLKTEKPDCFSQFRFRKAHFHRILRCFKDDNGQRMMVGNEPSLLKLGKTGHKTTVPSVRADVEDYISFADEF